MKLGIVRLYIGKSGEVGFYNIQEIGLAKALEKKGINTDIFFLIDNKKNDKVTIEEISKGIRLIYMPAKKILNHGIISPKFILDYKLDVVHLLSDNQIMAPIFISFCKKNSIPLYNVVGTINSDTNNKAKKIIMSLLKERNIKAFRKSNVIVKTESVKKELTHRKISNLQVIPIGLDMDIIPIITETKLEIREELDISREKKVLIFVGRLEEYKNPLNAIELIKNLKDIDNDYTLIIIGDGSLKDKITEKINKYKLENNVIMIDKVKNSEIHKYYKASDIFINFNENEIFGMSILEAMNQECKVIAASAPGPRSIIDNKVNGILIDNSSVDVWIKAIEDNINNKTMGIEARKTIKEHLNWDNIAEKYIKLFEELVGE